MTGGCIDAHTYHQSLLRGEAKMIDAHKTYESVVAGLVTMGFNPRDADGSDFQRGDDDGLRFKVGTSYGEVAIQVFGKKEPRGTFRINTIEQIESTLRVLQGMADDRVREQA